jgi:uncharacterized membrane-anchored protein
MLFAGLITVPALAYRWFGLNKILAFWSAYIVLERALRNDLGEKGFEILYRLIAALGGDEGVRLKDYLRKMRIGE